jgi:2,4-dienoyl-CoA reductase-like NADH-dependent reductase (Old Yellow Enzyme family)
MSKLFTPTQVGPCKLSHRVVMAPLTRMRSDPGCYTQRSSKGGLIISEATPVSTRGNGYAGAPGIYFDTQIAGWQRVTNAVHAKVHYVDGCRQTGQPIHCARIIRSRWMMSPLFIGLSPATVHLFGL